MSSVNMNEIFEQLNREIITKSLLHEEGEFVYSQELLTFISVNLNDKDKKACLHLNKDEMVELMSCLPESVMKARTFIPEMLQILCNIEPNAGDFSSVQGGHKGVD